MHEKTLQQPALVLRLLGDFSLERDGAKVDGLSYKKGRAILAYLASKPVAHNRQKLADLFWPDLPAKDALSNLRQVLLNLRKCLNGVPPSPPSLITDRQYVRFDPAGPCHSDLTEFCQELPTCTDPLSPGRHESCLARMEQTAGLYRGEFLAGFSLPECGEFENWLLIQRETMHRRALLRLDRLCNCLEPRSTFSRTIPFALRYMELEPWNDKGHRRVIRLLAQDGQEGKALSHHESYCLMLKRELGILPSAETQLLAESIRSGSQSSRAPKNQVNIEDTSLPERRLVRRQVTVLYCELSPLEVDDPDEAMRLLSGPQLRCAELLAGFSGHRVQNHGGGVLAYFGYPQAREDSARQAVRAALVLCAEKFEGLRVCAGVHTGYILTGKDPSVPDAIGSTTKIAMHLPFGAKTAEVLISAQTQRHVAGYFIATNLGRQNVHGISRPMELYRVTGESGANTRLEAATTLSPLCGRQSEQAMLIDFWEAAAIGSGKVMLLQGDAGIGKSRLILSLKERLSDGSCSVRELRCLPELSQSPLQPFINMFKELLGFALEDGPETNFSRLVNYAQNHTASRDPIAVPLLAAMLSIPLLEPYQEPSFTPAQNREKTYALVVECVMDLAAQQPLLLVIEDLHWADPSTLELLSQLVEAVPKSAILMLMSARSQLAPPWPEAQVSRYRLPPLFDEGARNLVKLLAADLSGEMVERIIERADGVPLFVEELTAMTRSAAPDNHTVIPVTLLDLLTARLDGIGEAKRTAQLAANLGGEFSLCMLKRISSLDEATLQQRLDTLLEAGLVQTMPHQCFQFKHALIQDAADQSQSRTDRQQAHKHIARILQTEFPEVVDTHPERLARHLSLAGQYAEAITYWIKAGTRAGLHSASQEAQMLFKEGLGLISKLEGSPHQIQLEFDLLLGLGSAACSTQGYGSTEAISAYRQAMELGERSGGPDMFRTTWGLWASASSRMGHSHALELAHQLLRMGRASHDPVQIQQGHFATGNILFWQGEFISAREHLEQAMALYQPEHHQQHISQFGENVRVTSGAYLSWTLWFLGCPDLALQTGEETLALARQLKHPFSLGYALTFISLLQRRLRLPKATLTAAEETQALAIAQGFPLWQAGADLMLGWGHVMTEKPAGMSRMLQSCETMRAVMGGVALIFLEPLIETHLHQGDYSRALTCLEEAFIAMETLGDRHVETELHRLKGECLLGQSPANEAAAEFCFQQALATSRRQQAKSLELRAAISLSRLWLRQNKPIEARALVQGVYRFFSEGIDTLDLREAKELLEQTT